MPIKTSGPRARALAALDLPPALVSALADYGILTLPQLLERAERQPEALGALAGRPAADLLELVRERCPEEFAAIQSRPPVLFSAPPPGLAGALETSPLLAERRTAARSERAAVREHLHALTRGPALPSRMLLTDWLPEVRDQGPHGFCVGFGSTTPREFLARTPLSPGFAYRGAKTLDGIPDAEGSFQIAAMEFFYSVGQVREAQYSYQDAIDGRPVKRLSSKARAWRIQGFADLLPDPEDLALTPLLMRAALAGRLSDGLGPQALSVSLMLYESMHHASTVTTGLVSLPLPGEPRTGGHAMAVVGYLDARDPDGLYDTDFFIVRNSWGAQWAAANPLGLPGHALIPAAYFTRPETALELLLCIAEPSPALHKGLLGRLWRGMRGRLH